MRGGEVLLGPGDRLDPVTARPAGLGRLGRAAGPAPAAWSTIASTGDELDPPRAGPRPRPDPQQQRHGPRRPSSAPPAASPTRRRSPRTTRPPLRTLLAHGLRKDVLLITGGVSAGKPRPRPRHLEELGMRAVFHKVRLKPGKPLLFGVGPTATDGRPGPLVFGLPGNPVSGVVGFLLFVAPGPARPPRPAGRTRRPPSRPASPPPSPTGATARPTTPPRLADGPDGPTVEPPALGRLGRPPDRRQRRRLPRLRGRRPRPRRPARPSRSSPSPASIDPLSPAIDSGPPDRWPLVGSAVRTDLPHRHRLRSAPRPARPTRSPQTGP